MEDEVELVHDLNALPVDKERSAEGAGGHLVEGEFDVLGGELVAVVEIDVVAQLDIDVAAILASLITFGEVALDSAAVAPILVEQGVIDLAVNKRVGQVGHARAEVVVVHGLTRGDDDELGLSAARVIRVTGILGTSAAGGGKRERKGHSQQEYDRDQSFFHSITS